MKRKLHSCGRPERDLGLSPGQELAFHVWAEDMTAMIAGVLNMPFSPGARGPEYNYTTGRAAYEAREAVEKTAEDRVN